MFLDPDLISFVKILVKEDQSLRGAIKSKNVPKRGKSPKGGEGSAQEIKK